MRKLATLFLLPLLLLAACGGDDGEDTSTDGGTEGDAGTATDEVTPAEDDPVLDAVTVDGELGEKPTVEVSEPVEIDGTARRLLIEGEGEPVADGMEINLQILAADGEDGAELYDGFQAAPPVMVDFASYARAMARGLVDVPLGSRVLVAVAQEELAAEGDLTGTGMENADVILMVFDVTEPPPPLNNDDAPSRAEGTAVDPVEGLPTVTLGDDGAPTIEVPDEDPPAELVSQLLIEGEGDPVPEGGRVLAHYTGVLWADGSEFDTSWDDGEPVEFGLAEVVPGWAEGLAGQPVGSQVLLVIPPELGYREQGAPPDIPPNATLVFVVDILAAR